MFHFISVAGLKSKLLFVVQMREDDRVAIHEAMEQQTISIAKVLPSCVFQKKKQKRTQFPSCTERLSGQTNVSTPPQAGITTTLNSRCSVLAAANSVFGRWDDTKGEDNIDFMPTILSRFDMIFIIKDQHDQQRDMVRRRTYGRCFCLDVCRF